MIDKAIKAAIDAGNAIMEIYEQDFNVEIKSDKSPLTAADKKSHEIIVEALESTPYPVLSEESAKITIAERENWQTYWLVDPLDGTKEFIKKNGEFTVNIALVENGFPILGIVYVPVVHALYVGVTKAGLGCKEGAWKVEHCVGEFMEGILVNADRCEVSGKPGVPFKVVASKSHCNDATRKFIADLEEMHGEVATVSRGSSLKLCMVAEGIADMYPRIAPTMEWDTAAAHAVVVAAGGAVFEFDENLPVSAYVIAGGNPERKQRVTPIALHYNKQNLLNPYFVASGLHK